MGYCVDITLNDVKFKHEDADKVIAVLKFLNKRWIETYDWRRFDESLKDVTEIFNDIGYELLDKCGFYVISEFMREKLGDDERMFRLLAPFLEDCSIKIVGEDDAAWKIVIKDKAVKEITHRETF